MTNPPTRAGGFVWENRDDTRAGNQPAREILADLLRQRLKSGHLGVCRPHRIVGVGRLARQRHRQLLVDLFAAFLRGVTHQPPVHHVTEPVDGKLEQVDAVPGRLARQQRPLLSGDRDQPRRR